MENNKILTPREAATGYHKRGWQPIPISHKSKNPNFPKWTEFSCAEVDLPKHFGEQPQNIGVLLGKSSNGLVDIDLDSPEAVKIADRFLPPTSAIFGRESNQKSHYLYRSENAETMKFECDGMICEIRATGHQTVFPNSTHESGECVEWFEDGEPSEISFQDLRRAVGKLAGAALLATKWTANNRHNPAMALCGGLARHGWKEDDIKHFIESVCIAANDDDVADRLNCVDSTFDKIAAGENATGFPQLAELTDKKTVDKLIEWLGIELEQDGETKGNNQVSKLINLVNRHNIELFHTPNKEAFARVSANEHLETVEIQSAGFRDWLSFLCHKNKMSQPANAVFDGVIAHFTAQAKFDSERREVFLRVAEHSGDIFIDTGNETWQAIKVTKDGWQVIESKDCAVMFWRNDGMLPLPLPKRGGSIQDLRRFINVSDESFPLVLAWCLACLNPSIDYPILALQGEQGSGKSFTTRKLQALIDPQDAEFNADPKDEKEIMISAYNCWISCFDNLKRVSESVSNTVCRIATGASYKGRKLYKDKELSNIKVRRPQILNGITDILTKSDALDRSILVECPTITSVGRKEKGELDREFEAARPFLLGALLEAVAAALREKPSVKLTEMERMADFQVWANAGETTLGLKKGDFNRYYLANRKDAHELAEEVNPMIRVIAAFMENRKGDWRGQPQELLNDLRVFVNSNAVTLNFSPDRLPRTANTLSGQIRSIAPNLRAKGIDFESKKSGRRLITLRGTNLQPTPQEKPKAKNVVDFTGSDKVKALLDKWNISEKPKIAA